jgi:hypothetical protein
MRFTVQELIDIYAKVSPQRIQREQRNHHRGLEHGASHALKSNLGGQKREQLGLFPINAKRSSGRPCNWPLASELSELPSLPYFDKIEQYGRRISRYYTMNRHIVDQLCINKRELLQRYFDFNCSKLTHASLLQLNQHDVAKYCKALSKDEVRQGKRKLGEFLAQGDFFSGGGKIGYYYQDKNLLCEVEFDVWASQQARSTALQSTKDTTLYSGLG